MDKNNRPVKNFSGIAPKTKKRLLSCIRAAVQLAFFIFLPSAFTSGFSAVKYIFTQIGIGAPVRLTAFVTIFLVLCGYTIVFGRFFCGFACAFGALGDAVRGGYVFICKRLGKKPVTVNRTAAKWLSCVKYLILTTVVLMCYFGVYGKLRGYSPWDVFSMLRAGNFRLSGYGLGIGLLAAVIILMALTERGFCRFICPMGAVFSLLPVLPLFSLRRDRESCVKGCSACERNCPADVSLPDANDPTGCQRGECLQCQKCISVCPRKNVTTGIKGLHGNEIWFTIVRAAVLAALLVWAGC